MSASKAVFGISTRHVLTLKRRIRNLREMIEEEEESRSAAGSNRLERMKRQLSDAEAQLLRVVSVTRPS